MTDVNTTETTMQGVKQPGGKALAMQVQRKSVCYFENFCCPNNMVYLAPDCMDRYFPNNTITVDIGMFWSSLDLRQVRLRLFCAATKDKTVLLK